MNRYPAGWNFLSRFNLRRHKVHRKSPTRAQSHQKNKPLKIQVKNLITISWSGRTRLISVPYTKTWRMLNCSFGKFSGKKIKRWVIWRLHIINSTKAWLHLSVTSSKTLRTWLLKLSILLKWARESRKGCVLGIACQFLWFHWNRAKKIRGRLLFNTSKTYILKMCSSSKMVNIWLLLKI